MQKILLIIFVLFSFISSGQQTLDEDTKVSLNGILISKKYVKTIQNKTGRTFEDLKFYQWKDSIIDTTNYGHYDTLSHGIVFNSIDEQLAREIFNSLRKKITAEGNYIFLTYLAFDSLHQPLFDIAIVQAKTQFDVVQRFGTQSLNYDIKTKDIIDKLEKWDKLYHLVIVVVDINRVEANIINDILLMKKLTKEVAEFCPDVIEKTYGNLEAMTEDYYNRKYLWLWWE